MMNDNVEWKVGMEVVLFNTRDQPTGIRKIEKVTPKGFIRINGHDSLFKPNGIERTSDPWRWHRIRPSTPEDVMKLQELKVRIAYLSSVKRNSEIIRTVVSKTITIEYLKKINTLMEEAIEAVNGT